MSDKIYSSFEEFYNGESFSVYGCGKENLERAYNSRNAEIQELKDKVEKLEKEVMAAKCCNSKIDILNQIDDFFKA